MNAVLVAVADSLTVKADRILQTTVSKMQAQKNTEN